MSVPVPAFLNASVGRGGTDPAWRRDLFCVHGGYGWPGGNYKTHGFTFTTTLIASDGLLAAARHWTVTARRKGAVSTWNDVDLHVLCSVHDVRMYTDHDDAEEDCTLCPAGWFDTGPRVKHTCDACAPGRYSTSTGSATIESCHACPLGMWRSSSATTCLNCSAGRYGYRAGMSIEWLACEISEVGCAMCKTGFWQDESGASEERVPAGFVGSQPRPRGKQL